MAKAKTANTGTRAMILRALQSSGEGYVTDRLLLAITGMAEVTLRTHVCHLRKRGLLIARVLDKAGNGYRIIPTKAQPVPEPVAMAAE